MNNRSVGGFFKSVIPFILILVFLIVSSIIILTVNAAIDLQSGLDMDTVLNSLQSGSSTDSQTMAELYILFSVISLIVFGIWYRRRFVLPDLYETPTVKRGFSLPLILALIILAVGMQFICSYIITGLEKVIPDSVTSLSDSITDLLSITDLTGVILAVYIIILAPIVEELVFRGLVMRLCGLTVPFAVANIWQAILFGIYHMNPVQGIYAFCMGLFLGFVAWKGGGIRYSIFLHIVFNFLPYILNSFISGVSLMFPGKVLAVAIVISAFALYVFWNEFTIPKKKAPVQEEPVYEDEPSSPSSYTSNQTHRYDR